MGRVVPATRKQIEILVVESNPADTQLTEIAFKAAGLTSGFRSVSNGEDALAYVHKRGKYANVSTPDLIFLDLSLPRVSGLESNQNDPSPGPDSSCFWVRRPRTRQSCLRAEWQQLHAQAA